MRTSTYLILLLGAIPQLCLAISPPTDGTIIRDVCILGGGSTGTYAAIRLSQGMGKSVVVVEKTGRLGGHTETYTDTITHYPVDFGVQVFMDLPHVRNYFNRLNVSLTPIAGSPFATKNVDFSTGILQNPIPSDPTQALDILAQQLAKYSYLTTGYNLSEPIEEDLLLPFGEFVEKYNIQAAVPYAEIFAHGVGDLLKSPSLYVFQNFGLPQLTMLRNGANGGYMTTAKHSNSNLYLAASKLLGSNVLYSSTAISIERSADNKSPHRILVQIPTGNKLILAKQLLITIPPTIDNLAPLDMTQEEEFLFKQWQWTTYYTGIVRGGIPDGTSLINFANHTTYNVPLPPYIRNFDFSGVPGLHTFQTISLSTQSADEVRELVTSQIDLMNERGTFASGAAIVEIMSDHSPIAMRVTPDSIRSGFYKDLYSLQGCLGTFWTGAAWAQDDSSLLWAFTERVMGHLVAE